jgi:thiol-disulfide isomerase/thioredoxin
MANRFHAGVRHFRNALIGNALIIGIAGIALTATLRVAQATPVKAADVVKRAETEARHQKKNVFVYFHASWCPWCKRLEKLLDDTTYGPKFRASYVIAAIDIRERGEKQKDENPGWESLMASLRGAAEQDVPYYVILSPKGQKLGDSYRVAEARIPNNAGYPQTEAEIQGFLDLLAKTASAFTPPDLKDLGDTFRAQSKPHTP